MTDRMIVYRFANEEGEGATRWCHADGSRQLNRPLPRPVRQMILQAVWESRNPYEEPDLGGIRPGEVCGLTFEQLTDAAQVMDGEEVWLPGILWAMDVPLDAVRVGRDQVLINLQWPDAPDKSVYAHERIER